MLYKILSALLFLDVLKVETAGDEDEVYEMDEIN